MLGERVERGPDLAPDATGLPEELGDLVDVGFAGGELPGHAGPGLEPEPCRQQFGDGVGRLDVGVGQRRRVVAVGAVRVTDEQERAPVGQRGDGTAVLARRDLRRVAVLGPFDADATVCQHVTQPLVAPQIRVELSLVEKVVHVAGVPLE
ncbi:hypothetical protein ACFQL1_04930 [Halomicroarcula sp. GCM10025709]|uniref:hypothetical protein n=1 Tax=Halomicroarcula sp. GCM10025709 TaxID=3252669 RepID=UPI00360CA3DD